MKKRNKPNNYQWIHFINTTLQLAVISSFVLLSGVTFSQTSTAIQYTSKNGLPSSEVYDIVQDDYGFIWFSTDKGISRFNGYEFTNYDETDGLPEHVVFDFLKVENGDIWCTTLSGELFTISGYHPKFTNYKYNKIILKHKTPSSGPVNSLFVSKQGDVLVAFKGRLNFLHIDKKGNVVAKPQPAVRFFKIRLAVAIDDTSEPFFYRTCDLDCKEKTKNHHIFKQILKTNLEFLNPEALCFKQNETFVLMTDEEIIVENKNGKKQRENLPFFISSGKLRNSLFWTGHRNHGAYVYDLEGNLVTHLLPNETVTQVMLDDQNNYWISTSDHGVFLLNNFSLQQLSLGDQANERINSLESDGKHLFIGTYYGGITKLISTKQFSNFSPFQLHRPVSIFHCKENKLTYFTSNLSFDSEKKEIHSIEAIANFSDGNKIVFLRYSQLIVENFKTKSKKTYTLPARSSDVCIIDGRVYLGSHEGLFELKNNQFVRIRALKKYRINRVSSFNNFIVVCTNGYGVFVLTKDHKLKHHFTTQNGLSSNFISNVHCEGSKELWCSSNVGVDKIILNNRPIVASINLQEFLPNNEISDLIIFKDTLWIATKAGLIYLPKNKVFKQSKSRNYYLNLRSIAVNGKARIVHNNQVFGHLENELEINFGAISFMNASLLNYRYKLMGSNPKWRYTNQRSVNYSALSPGKYTFVVQVKGDNHSWNLNEIVLSFEIKSPIWKTWWFITSMVLALCFLIYLFFKYRILSYNRSIITEILRQLLKRIKRKTHFVIVKHQGKEMKLDSAKIHFIKSDGNYLEIHTEERVYLHRASFEQFIKELPDSIEYLRIHRSYLIRIDNVQGKGNKTVFMLNQEIPVGRKYWKDIEVI